MRIDIYSDNVCPWCRIGKQNMMEAIRQWSGSEEIIINWKSFQLDPTVPTTGMPFLEDLERKFDNPEQLQQMLGHVCQVGEACGATFDFDKIVLSPNTKLSHQLAKQVPHEKQTEVVDRTLKAFFEEGRNIGDIEVLADIAEEAGLDRELYRTKLANNEGSAEVEEDLEFARRAGIRSVPYFVFNNKYGLSGAQPVQAFLQAFDRVASEESGTEG